MWKIERRPGETKEEAERRFREEAQVEVEQNKRDEEARRRWLNSSLLFWRCCRSKRCNRARRCAGDVNPCFDRFWPQVPEELKVEIRATFTALAQGMPPHEATRHAEAEVARHLELAARFAQMAAD